jgi:hypothetical protein
MKKYLIAFLIISGIILPAISFAGMPDFNGPFVICGTSKTDACTLCDIFKMAQLIVDTVIGFLIIIAGPILVGVGGFMILLGGATPDSVNKGKLIIKNAIIGIIIALLAWTMINMIFNNLVGSTTDSTGKTVGKSFKGPWNEIKCEGGGINEDVASASSSGNYCVCEVPVYDLDPSSSMAQLFTKNVRATKLENADDCSNKCNASGASSYCPFMQTGLDANSAEFKCVEESYVKNTTVNFIKYPTATSSVINQIGCFSTLKECEDATVPGNAKFEECGRQCYMFGVNWCDRKWVNDTGICVTDSSLCPSGYMLERFKDEHLNSTKSLLDCSGLGQQEYCREENAIFEDTIRCDKEETTRCDDIKDFFACFDGYTCKQMVEDQTSDACTELKDILKCMKGKLQESDKIITSISDNSPDTNGSLGRCFNPSSDWGICGASKDSCSGTCCGHSFCSLHYGGKGNSDSNATVKSTCGIGTTDCRRCSWAVDFANGTNFNNLKTAAEDCAKELWSGNMKEIFIQSEGNHNHLQLNGAAKYHGCK